MKNRPMIVISFATSLFALLPAAHAGDSPTGELPAALASTGQEAALAVAPVEGVRDVWAAENAARGMRAVFTPRGLRVVGDKGRDDGFWLRLERWGRGDALRDVEEARGEANGRRVEYRRGGLTEWYVNDAHGVEQGFTIAERPAHEQGHACDPLRLVLGFHAAFDARVLPGERDAVFESAGNGDAIHYRGLRAWDADGRELETSLAIEGHALSIQVEDLDAVYPLTVDPWIWIEQAVLWASEAGSFDLFGHSVSLDGDTALVGAHGNADLGPLTGAAYAFVRAGTTWTQQAKLQPNDIQAEYQFARDVSLDGDTAVFGSLHNTGGGIYRGSAYVFVRTGTAWSQQAKIIAGGGQPNDLFGNAVDIDGDTMLVGAPGVDSGADVDEGATYVFVRSGTTWTQEAKLDASAGAYQMVGTDVALDGDTALLAAEDSAFVFVRTGTTWTEQAVLPACCSYYGTFVALSGDTALVAADAATKVYVYVRTGTSWSLQTEWTGSGDTYDYFGESVALDGDLALVGRGSDQCIRWAVGSASLFERLGTTWSEKARISPGCYTEKSGDFAISLDLDGETALIGDLWGHSSAGFYAGAAFVYELAASASATLRNAGLNPESYAVVSPPVLGDVYRSTVDLAGTTGHGFAWLVGYAGPLSLALGGGRVLLVNVTAPGGELLGQAVQAGPLASFDLPVPLDTALLGFELSTQALHLGGGVQPFALSNAQDLFLGH